MRKRDGKKPQGFVDVSYQWRYWSTPRLAANIFFQPVAILFSTSNASWLYRNHGMRENPLFTAQLMLNFSRSKLWRSNAIIIFSTTNTVFPDYRSHRLMNKKKLRSFRKRNQAKERKKDKRRLHEEKGRKKPQGFECFLPRYWWAFSLAVQMCFYRQNFLPDIFSITANLLLYIAAIITMFKKKSFQKQNQGKEKKRNRCKSSSLGKDLFILRTPRLLLDIEFLRSDLFFFFLNSSILTSLHMTKIITQKKIPRRQASQNHQKKITTNTRIVGFLARRSDKKSPSKNCGNKRRRKSGATGWRRKGRGTFSWTRARMAGDKGGRPVRPPAHLPAQGGYLTST